MRGFIRAMAAMAVAFTWAAPASAEDPQYFLDAANQEVPAPPPDKAQIVLLEPLDTVAAGIPVATWLMKGEERHLVAVTTRTSKAVILLDPGTHRLMSTNMLGKVHFLDATVEAGKRYYVLLRFVYAQGFQLRPIRTTAVSDFNMVGADWKVWVENSKRLVEKGPASDEHFQKERVTKRLGKLYAKAVEEWNAKTADQRAELTLTTADAAPL
jgi:hypothetical protein